MKEATVILEDGSSFKDDFSANDPIEVIKNYYLGYMFNVEGKDKLCTSVEINHTAAVQANIRTVFNYEGDK